MSEVTTEYEKHKVYGGIVVDVANDSLGKVIERLGNTTEINKAVGAALTRAAASGKTAVKKTVTGEYTISQSEFLKDTRNINHIQWSGSDGVSVVFGYRGYVIPLLKFNTRVDSKGYVVTQVKRSDPAETLERAFVAVFNGHREVRERAGAERIPTEQLYGPSTPQMMYSNEAVMDTVEEKMVETYEKRIDHEIDAILNGWW
jgi:hypothetical protein